MSIITQIKPQKNKNRVNIYLDGKYSFGLDLENFIKLGLKVEQELTESEVDEIVKQAEFQKTLDKLLSFTTLRPRSRKEITDWFIRRKVPQSLHKELIDRLMNYKLLDDYQFAKWWLGQRLQFKLKSKKELVYELRIKGVEKNIIEDVFNETEISDIETAQKLLKRNIYRWDRFNVKERIRKSSEFLARKGYRWETIKKVIGSTKKL